MAEIFDTPVRAFADAQHRITELDADTVTVLLAVALDLDPRPIRTASLLATAGAELTDGGPFSAQAVHQEMVRLANAEIIVRRDRREKIDPEFALAATLAAYAQLPGLGKALAEAILQSSGYTQAGTASNKASRGGRAYRDWNYVYDYDGFPLRTRRLLLADRPEDFQAELKDITNHHEWRVPARKAEAIAEALEPFQHFDYGFFQHLNVAFRLRAFREAVFGKAVWSEQTASSIVAFLKDPNKDLRELEPEDAALLGFGASLALHRFEKESAQEQSESRAETLHPRASMVVTTVYGRVEQAEAEAQELVSLPDRVTGLADILAALSRLRQNEAYIYDLAKEMRAWRDGPIPAATAALRAYVQWSIGDVDACDRLLTQHFGMRKRTEHTLEDDALLPKAPPVAWMVALWTYAWTGLKPQPTALEGLLDHLESTSFGQPAPIAYQHYVRGELLNALANVLPGDPRAAKWRSSADQLAELYELRYLLDLQPVPEPWEYALRVIKTVAHETKERQPEAAPQTRLLWVVDFEAQTIIPREQKRGKRGWSKGRQVSVADLIEHAGSGRFKEEDVRAIEAAQRYDGRPVALGERYGAEVRMDFGRTLYHLDGHSRVVLDDAKRIPLEIVRATPQLFVDDAAEDVHLSFTPAGAHRAGYHWDKETPTRYRVYAISPEQARLARAIGRETIIPAENRAGIDERLDALRVHVGVQAVSELAGEDLPEVLGDTRPCAHLLPYGLAYKLELYARPLPEEELYLRIGEGQSRSVVVRHPAGSLVEADDPAAEAARTASAERVLLMRDLPAEQRAAEAMVADCPTLRELEHSDLEWTLHDDNAALRVLLELRALQRDERISVEHPKGERLRLVGATTADSLRIQIRKERDWFEVSGKVTADEGTVVTFRQLLAHLRNGGSEFVELSEGEFIAITEELRARLEAMEALVQERGGSVQLATLAAPAFSELIDDLDDLDVDDAWRQNLARIAATAEFVPDLPDDFRGELRDYQVVGYRWLRRLAEWGVGGCLADDMGLGKTVQALALLVARQEEGPALVIAPASVTRNWISETERFAPTLRPRLLATSSDVDILHDLGPRDLLLVSYGLLTFVEEQLLATEFATIVLDEAQAIKNPATKRAKLIFKLQGELRIATTGTPIENHLGELWSLFRYLNPGLLGSRRGFNEKYAGPIRRENNVERAEALRRLVRPFVLRRRKEEVLKELPPKTEVNLIVTLSEGEKALYEALRREAVEAIDDASPNAQRMIVLQQLTRLRQAACHPKLVRPKSTLPSAKLDLVGSTVLELLENGHQALIFSQFVRHLKLVEQWVQAAGIRYCYLDGSTPGGKRQKQVEAFQNGEADIFLISLKAGGTGLNLTAADFVLHLDPWWNPAAEDQASDRAHRIGQQRPVTVYRFVSEGTIEERILALHAEKRDLADQILKGTDAGGKLSVGEVVDLLKEDLGG